VVPELANRYFFLTQFDSASPMITPDAGHSGLP